MGENHWELIWLQPGEFKSVKTFLRILWEDPVRTQWLPPWLTPAQCGGDINIPETASPAQPSQAPRLREIFDDNLELGQPSMSTVFPHSALGPTHSAPVIHLLVLYQNSFNFLGEQKSNLYISPLNLANLWGGEFLFEEELPPCKAGYLNYKVNFSKNPLWCR